MSEHQIRIIQVENLLLDLHNPRFDVRSNQRDALSIIAVQHGGKLYQLAEDIAWHGLNPSELPIVALADDDGFYVVVEGNRRIAALKLMRSPQLAASIGLTKGLQDRFRKLNQDFGHSLPDTVKCCVLSHEEAKHWILLKHTGEMGGVGVVSWDGRSRQRFRGSSPALQAIELVERSGLLDNDTQKKLPKIAITNVDRILSTAEARKVLGIDIQAGEIVLSEPRSRSLARLVKMVSDIANRYIRVSDLDRKEQRIAYAQRIANQFALELKATSNSRETILPSDNPQKLNLIQSTKLSRDIVSERRSVIPRSFKIKTDNYLLSILVKELKELSIEKYSGSCILLFRLLVETSIQMFIEKNIASLTKGRLSAEISKSYVIKYQKNDNIRDGILLVVEYLAENNFLKQEDLDRISVSLEDTKHILVVKKSDLQAIEIDNDLFSSRLKHIWDILQPLMQIILA